MSNSNINTLKQVTRELFAILDEFFIRVTGKTYVEFSKQGDFDKQIKTHAREIALRAQEAYPWGHNTLQKFYSKHKLTLFSAAKDLHGLKLVLGGTSRFTRTHLDSVRKMLLYADTILIPDPILPWIEVEREEERFKNVLFLEAVFILLHLKQLADADLLFPAIAVFPSWEKSLELKDPTTQSNIDNIIIRFISHHIGVKLESETDMVNYVRKHETEFLNCVDSKGIFIAPGGVSGTPLKISLNTYKEEMRKWRSKEFLQMLETNSDGLIVLNALMERIIPQYHLLENANELASQPMVCLPAHWHYYNLCAQLFESNLMEHALLEQATVSALRALNEPQLKWLGDVPMDALVTLRENNENESFRSELLNYTQHLHSASLEDINRVATEVSRGLTSLLAKHQKRIAEIQSKYKKLHTQTALAGWVTLAVGLIPTLAPFVSATGPITIGLKYAHDKLNEGQERKQASKSLIGILATAKNETQ